MNLNLPRSGRVVVIDDKADEALPLVKVISKDRISVTYFTGTKEELPEQSFSDVRLVFLDIMLEGAEGTDDKTKLSIAIGVIKRIIHKDNGPFILAVWTKHKELIEKMEKRLKEEKYQPIVTDLQKYEFKDDKTGNYNYNFLQIEKKIKEKLKNLSVFEIFLLWENMVHRSASSVVNEFSRFVKFNDSWNGELKNIFYKLAEAQAGKTLDTNSSQEVLKNALFTFDGIFIDTLEKNLHSNSDGMNVSFSESSVGDNIIGQINSKLLLDTSNLEVLYPGNVYEIKKDNLLKEIIYDSIYPEKLLKEFADMKGVNLDVILDKDKKIKKYKPEFKIFFKKIRDTIKDNSIFVQTEVSPLCDFTQHKMKLSRIVKGFLCPVEVQIDGTTIQTYKKLKSNAYFLYISPAVEYNEKLYRLVIDFRHFSAKSIAGINENTPIFRLRKDILIDIQTKLSSHINRPGVLFVE